MNGLRCLACVIAVTGGLSASWPLPAAEREIDGAEVFVFDDLNCVGNGGPVPVTWNEKEKDEQTGEPRFIVKCPPAVGFWPAGAKQSDGSVQLSGGTV